MRHARRLVIGLLVVVLTAWLTGCESDDAYAEGPGPEETFERFLLDWYQGNRQAAFEAIAPQDRQRLTRPLERLEGRIDPKALPEDFEMLMPGRVETPYDFRKVKARQSFEAAPAKGTAVTLDLVHQDGREATATMVWGGDRWYVDLPDSTEAGAADGEAPRPDEAPAPGGAVDAASAGVEEAADTARGQAQQPADNATPDEGRTTP